MTRNHGTRNGDAILTFDLPGNCCEKLRHKLTLNKNLLRSSQIVNFELQTKLINCFTIADQQKTGGSNLGNNLFLY